MTNQPKWVLKANLGDVNPLDYGGYFVYEDQTGVYEAEAEKLFVDDEYDYVKSVTIYRIELERLKKVALNGVHFLVPFTYESDWYHPLRDYEVWFAKKLVNVASFVGITRQEAVDSLCSDDACRRALIYEALYDYCGWDNGDGYPLHLSIKEARKRYE